MEKCDRIGVMIRCGNLVITPCPVLVFAAPERDFLFIDRFRKGRPSLSISQCDWIP